MHGATRLTSVTVERTASGAREDLAIDALFSFIGAVPASGWLGECLVTDADGFVLTDRDLDEDVLAGPSWVALDRQPLPFETSRPGVFAAGDVRSGSVKRVAAAVGEGSSAVRSIHEHLAAHG